MSYLKGVWFSVSNKINNKEGFKLILKLSKFMGKDNKVYLLGKLLATLEIINLIIFPYIFQQMITIVTDASLDIKSEIIRMFGLLLTIVLLTPIICYGTFISQKSYIRGSANLKKVIFSHIQNLDTEKTGNKRIGDYLTVLSSDAGNSFRVFVSFGIKSVFQFLIVFPITAVILLYNSWQIALVAIVFSFACIAISSIFNPKVSKLSMEAKQEMGTTANHLIELVSGFSVIRMFATYEKQLASFITTCKTIFSKRVKYRTLNGIVDSFLNFFQLAAQPFTLIIGLFLIVFSQSDTATIVLVSSVAGVMADSARGVGTFIANIQPTLTSTRRVFELLDIEEEQDRVSTAKPNFESQIALSIDNLCFSYNNKDFVLSDFSCKVKKGEIVALVGDSGCGKSTLFKLIQELYEPTSGNISYFGVNREQLSKEDIRHLISYVPQDCNLFEGSIAYNISLGNVNASQEQIEKAADLAHLGNFIANSKEGYNTLVGERGAQLSGGERQRVAIARAFLKNSPILLLDEATSALDADSEKEVLMALDELMKGRTTLIISHQETATDKADRVIHMVVSNSEHKKK